MQTKYKREMDFIVAQASIAYEKSSKSSKFIVLKKKNHYMQPGNIFS